MKNYLIALTAFLCINVHCQTSMQLTYSKLQVDTIYPAMTQGTFAPNTIIRVPTWDSCLTTVTINIKNIGTATHTYQVQRYDLALNIPTSHIDTAQAYFCFGGSCFSDTNFVSPNNVVLAQNASTADNPGLSLMLLADLDEAKVNGYSFVKYTFRNVADANDSIQFSIKYNDPALVGITKTNKTLSNSLEIYPNPARMNTVLKINSLKSFESKLMLYNALGSMVYSENLSIAEGKNQIPLNVEGLPPGIYVASIKQGEQTITKRFIVD